MWGQWVMFGFGACIGGAVSWWYASKSYSKLAREHMQLVGKYNELWSLGEVFPPYTGQAVDQGNEDPARDH